jgi:hypothetical protein
MAAVAEDWARGRLVGPPTDEESAAQIARFGGYARPMSTPSSSAASYDEGWKTNSPNEFWAAKERDMVLRWMKSCLSSSLPPVALSPTAGA